MDVQADIHRHFASALSEEVVKPLKQLLESQHRIRKSVETAVDKSGKNLAEWRAAESKAKKNSFTCARENEKLREPNNETRNSRLSASSLHIHKQGTDKETKLESKRRKAEECVKKADVEYYTVCLRAERSRLEWESAIVRGSHCFQVLEEERLRGLKDLATSYVQNHNNIGPKFTQMCARIAEPLDGCNIEKDLEIVSSLRTATEPSQEQMLPDFYPEHTALAMNRDRRKQALINLLQLIRADLERERRGKVGVENLARALKQTPTFASEDSQQNVHDKLHHMRSMLTYLEAARYKVQSALAELEGGSAVSHPLAGHIHVTRDRQGYQQSVLKVPHWVHNETLDLSSEYSDWVDRGTADGTSVQPDSDFDEFSSQGSEKDFETSVIKVPEATPQRCKALYNYTANLYDELTLNPGDIINIHDKQPDGWWLGELNGVVGIFPATYVEEIK
ncbi:hypothetical protein O3M35_001771 [Rhynocoris fuscipes]|uniref:Nostrin n=1 Tax=Rhynocoris fuscipes TaxID=488301 RepID=A0AAW1CUK8_9HEMI